MIYKITIAIFKLTRIISFEIESVKKLDFKNQTYHLPFKFYYKFTDADEKTSRLQIIDQEISELTRKLLRQYKNHGTVEEILTEKYFTGMKNRYIYLQAQIGNGIFVKVQIHL